MGLLKKLIKAYKDDRENSQLFLSKVAANDKKPIVVTSSNEYQIPSNVLLESRRIGDCTPAFRFCIPVVNVQHASLKAVLDGGFYSFDPVIDADDINLEVGKLFIGKILEHADIIRDWVSKKDPLCIYLDRYSYGQNCYVTVVLYKDKSNAHKWRSQSVFLLDDYQTEEAQRGVLLADSKLEVNFLISEETQASKAKTPVYCCDDFIGYLPMNIASRVSKDGYAFAEIDHIEADWDSHANRIFSPFVRVYW